MCNAAAGQKCDAASGTCAVLTPLGNTTPTGIFFKYAIFTTSNSVFKGGYDVASYGDYIYVNRGDPTLGQGIAMDVYKVTLHDSDGDGELEPEQHPDNPDSAGPMEQRTLTLSATYTTAAPDNAPMGKASYGEMWAAADRVYMLSAPRNGDITEYVLATKTSTVVADSLASFPLSFLGRGGQDNLWYAGNESARRVYSFCPTQQEWMAEFEYPVLAGAGTHPDGLEVVVAPATGVQYVYVSDMTSDFLGQYRRDNNGGWIQENMFKCNDATGTNVEGMGFGALNHFWITYGTTLYEIGGGDLSGYLK
jgi:hypothetical protein